MGFGHDTAGPAREQATAKAHTRDAAPTPTPAAASLLSVQRSAGNTAVQAMLRRAPAPAAPAPAEDTDAALTGLFADAGVDGLAATPGPGAYKPAAQKAKGARYEATLFGGMDATPEGPRQKTLEGTEKERKATPLRAAPPRNKQDAEADLAKLRERVSRFPNIAETNFMAHMEAYVRNAMAEPPDDVAAEANMLAALSDLRGVNAFTIGNVVYERVGAKPDPKVLDELAAEAMEGVHLWSKLNKFLAIEAVEGGLKGNSLEASAAGFLFDGLEFGMKYFGSDLLKTQWTEVSRSFVSQARGVVHAQVLDGIDQDSVLTKTEWPKIQELMFAGQVVLFVVHIFEFRRDPSHPDGGEVVEVSQVPIYHPSDFLKLPSMSQWNEGSGSYESFYKWEKQDPKADDPNAPRSHQARKVRNDEIDPKTGKKREATVDDWAEYQDDAQKAEAARAERLKQFRESTARFVPLEKTE